MWKASNDPVPLVRALWAPTPLPPKKLFPIFPSKTPFVASLRLEKRCTRPIVHLICSEIIINFEVLKLSLNECHLFMSPP